jgi:CRISP-associated protein Cas1
MKRIIEVSSRGASLALRHGGLVIRHERQEVARIPLEDLGALILANGATTATSALLAALAAEGGVTVLCGPDHQPDGVLLPLRAHSTRAERIAAQVHGGQPLKKQLWARIVAAKITNQAALIQDPRSRSTLERHARAVRSGDPENREAQAARLYWPVIFAESHEEFASTIFRRSDPSLWPNTCLNYGYAILRAITARAICAAGLMPEIGVHHHNRYDPFALASDLMEPFRAWVDLATLELLDLGPGELDRDRKQLLLGIYERPARLDSGQTPLWIAIQNCAAQLAAAFLAAQDGESAREAAMRLSFPRVRLPHAG